MCNQGWRRLMRMWFRWPLQTLHPYPLPRATVDQRVNILILIVTRTLIHIFPDLTIALPVATPVLLLITWNWEPLHKKRPRCFALIGWFLIWYCTAFPVFSWVGGKFHKVPGVIYLRVHLLTLKSLPNMEQSSVLIDVSGTYLENSSCWTVANLRTKLLANS